VDGGIAKRVRGLSAFEVEALNRLVVRAARLMSTDQILILIGALDDEVRRRREAAAAHGSTIRPLL